MMEFVEAGLLCDVFENDGGVVNETAGGNGATKRVTNGSMSSAGGHAARLNGRRILLAERQHGGE
jgi:hypothetical protein